MAPDDAPKNFTPVTEPAPSAAASGPDSSTALRRLDAVLAGSVVVFAFLTALFPARNSDFLQQLASGRLVAHGEYPFGADPFTVAGERGGWSNHSWLFGLISYLVFQVPGVGPNAVVVLKAALVAALAVIMLCSSRVEGQRLYVPAMVAALALLALSARVLLQPVVVSYFLLGLTLWLLERPRRPSRKTEGQASSHAAWWGIPIVCVLWVNCDQWFFLGPLTVALYWFGEAIQRDRDGRPGLLALVLLASVAACFINPYHIRAFVLPGQLAFSEGMRVLQSEPGFRAVAIGPFNPLFFDSRIGLSPAGLAFFPLAVLGILSFAATWKSVRWWRLFVWIAFLGLALVHARAIPFFAVAAGPITSLNLVEFFARRAASADAVPERRHRLVLAGRVVSVVLGFFLVLVGAIGLLQASPQDDRRIGVGVAIDPILEQTVKDFARRLPESDESGRRCFNTTPDVAHYLSWFCPGVRGFMDARLPQFPEGAREFVAVKRSLAEPEDASSESEYRKIFRDKDLYFLVVHDAEPLRQLPLLQRLLSQPTEWALAAVAKRGVLLAWQDPKAEAPRALAPFSLEREAFGPAVEAYRPNPFAPSPRSQNWFNLLLEGEAPPSPYRFVGGNYLSLFEALAPAYQQRSYSEWQAACRASLTAAGGGNGPLANGGLLVAQSIYANDFMNQSDDGPPAALYLAIRAGRRAVAENPDDARAYFLLGESYYNLSRKTRERAANSPFLQNLRQIQAVACFRQALALDPKLDIPHLRLAELFQRQFNDLRLAHLTRYYELVKASTPAFPHLEALEKQLEDDRADVRMREDRYEIDSASRHPLQKAQIALRLGLAEKAFEVLQQMPKEEMEKQGNRQAVAAILDISLRLMFATGQVREARELLDTPLKRALGGIQELQVPAAEWYQVLLAGVAGDGDDAEKFLTEILARTADAGRADSPFLIGQAILGQSVRVAGVPTLFDRLWSNLVAEAGRRIQGQLERELGLRLVGGLLAVEVGDMAKARAELRRAMELSGNGTDPQVYQLAKAYLSWFDAE